MKTLLIVTAILGALGVAFGAFGAHALQGKLQPNELANWDTAVKYQLIHVVVLLVLLLNTKYNSQTIAIFFIVGICLFSGSLYLLSAKHMLGMPNLSSVLWPVTPLGGLSLIIGWILLAVQFIKG